MTTRRGRADCASGGAERVDPVEFERDVVYPAIPPGFAWFEAPEKHMLGVGFEVPASVLVLGLVAASDATTRGAHAQMDPARPDSLTVLTSITAGANRGVGIGDVGTFDHGSLETSGAGPGGSGPPEVAPIILVM